VNRPILRGAGLVSKAASKINRNRGYFDQLLKPG
jgi:hypothetical protein